MEATPQLNETQISVVTALFQAILKDGNNVTEVVKDVRAALKGYGATDEDIEAIQKYLRYLETQLKDSVHYGWW